MSITINNPLSSSGRIAIYPPPDELLEERPDRFIKELEASAELDKQILYSETITLISDKVLRWAVRCLAKSGGKFLRPNEEFATRVRAAQNRTILPSVSKETAQWESYIKYLKESKSNIVHIIEKQYTNSPIKSLDDLILENQKLYGLLKAGCFTSFDPNYLYSGELSNFAISTNTRDFHLSKPIPIPPTLNEALRERLGLSSPFSRIIVRGRS